MIVFLIKKKEELMINMVLKNQNNIINIIDNNMERVQLNKYLEHSFHKMEVLKIYLEKLMAICLEMVLEGFNLFKLVQECFIILMDLEDKDNNIIEIIKDSMMMMMIIINNNKEDKVKEELVGFKFGAI
jgi:hypothetical protein